LIGWDGADWALIRPLLAAGKMPALKRFLEGSASGNLRTLEPMLSPMLWTSIATGKRAYKHGVHGFTEPTADGANVQPITNLGRTTKAIWNILSQSGLRCNVVGWWPSHPAEPINGVMVSNSFQHISGPATAPSPMPAGTVHPESWRSRLEECRVHPAEIQAEDVLPFIARAAEIDQPADPRLEMLSRILAETASIQAAAVLALREAPWDFAAVYYEGIDHFCHGFMRYHPPRLPWVPERDFELYNAVVEGGYRFHDMLLGVLLQAAGPETTVVLISDHGFHADHQRHAWIPAEAAGPAVDHRRFGILALRGPGIQPGAEAMGASLLDICPTLLHLCGLPVGADMDGKVLVNLLAGAAPVRTVASWDSVEGEAGMHRPDSRHDALADAEAMERLVELGYIEPPAADAATTVAASVRELRYNLARSYADGGLHSQAATLAEALWLESPAELRFGRLLIRCLQAGGDLSARAAAIERFATCAEAARSAAQQELAALQAAEAAAAPAAVPSAAEPAPAPAPARAKRATPEEHRRQFQLRKLHEQSRDPAPELRWLRLTQDLELGHLDAVRRELAAADAAPWGDAWVTARGRICLALRAWGQAEALFERAVLLDREDSAAWLGLAEARLRSNQADAAVDAALRSLELQFDDPLAHAVLGRAWLSLGDSERAAQALRTAVAMAPGFAQGHRLLGRVYERLLRQPAAAYAHLQLARQARLHKRARRGTRLVAAPEPPAPAPNSGAGLPPAPPLTPPADWPARSQVITIVSGLPRSGTSMLMQMLVAGGLEALTDGVRQPDESNPAGYLEYQPVTALRRDGSWVEQARGKVVKVVAPLVPALPAGFHYQIVLVRRPLATILASQAKMLQRLGRASASPPSEQALSGLRRQLIRFENWVTSQPNVRVLRLDYALAQEQPLLVAQQLDTFLGGGLDRPRMAAAVVPALNREGQPQPEP
jgi:tetratricopeptide (TPR) repeat protein